MAKLLRNSPISSRLINFYELFNRNVVFKSGTKRLISTTNFRPKKISLENVQSHDESKVLFGQPTARTHPHLLKGNEFVVGMSLPEIVERRYRLIDKIQQYCRSKGISEQIFVVVPASNKKYMTDKIPYVYRQNSDFYYLTGCLEPDGILVLTVDSSRATKSVLFMRPKSAYDELWDGPRTGPEQSVGFFNVNEAYSLSHFEVFTSNFASQNQSYSVWYDEMALVQPKLSSIIRQKLKSDAGKFENPTKILHEMRLIKSQAEIGLMRKTCEIASEAVNATMIDSKPGDSEHHIFARVDYHSRMLNASFLAYPPVVATGNNATTIHYIDNCQIAKDGELVLMDAGCEYGGYSSDITRTWPINGRFTAEQETLYDIVFAVQQNILQALDKRPNMTLDHLYELMCGLLGKYLQEIGFIDKSFSYRDLVHAASVFCPHHVSHYLGMDIHDTPTIGRDRPLTPGIVFTVEPGLYIPRSYKQVPAEFRGIGIRIEDDVCVQPSGTIEVLTSKCIKEKFELQKKIAAIAP